MVVDQLETAERTKPGWDEEGSLYTALHQLKNLTICLDTCPIADEAVRCLQAHRHGSLGTQNVSTLEDVLRTLREKDANALRAIPPALRRVAGPVSALVPAPIIPRPDERHASRKWLVLTVEDVPVWRLSVRRVVEVAQRQLGPAFELQYEEFTELASARLRLDAAYRNAARGGPRPLLVLDLGIPRGPGCAASFDAGRELLAHSRQKLNIPVIILTTPHHFLHDHLTAFRLGVADYLLKGAESERALLAAIVRTVTTRPARTLYVSDDGSRTVFIDGVEVRLNAVPFAVLAVVAGHMRGGRGMPVTIRTIEEELRGYPFFVEGKNIQDTVYKIRTALTEALRVTGRTLLADEEVLVSDHIGERLAYRVVARIVDKEGIVETESRRVLVVEDEIELWQRPMAQLLRRYGYDVAVAGSRTEAVTVARDFRPHLLCLDICLPDALGGMLDPQAGVCVLREVKANLPNVRAVLITSLAENDMLRNLAGELGVRPEDIVPKRAGLEETAVQLVLRLWRAELEVQRQAHLPLPNMPYLPYLRLSTTDDRESQLRLDEVQVFGRPWHPTKNEARLLVLLARRPGRSIPKQHIYDTLWPPDDSKDDIDPANALKLLVNRLRQRIATEWPFIKNLPNARSVANEILVNDGKEGYMLNARVDWVSTDGGS